MKVGCNLLWLVPGSVGGTETAVVSLLRQFAADRPDDVDLTIFALGAFGESYPDLVEAFPSRLAPLTGRLRPLRVGAENSWLARQTREGFDLVHHMGGVVPLVQRARGVLTIHDLQPFDMPENFTATKRAYLQRALPGSVRRAAAVMVPSEFVRAGVIDRFDVSPERVRVAAWGVDPPTSEVSVAQVQARYGLPRRWFAYPSFTWNHKNHLLLLRAFASVAAREHDVMLVMTGGEGPAEQAVSDEIGRLGLRGRVRRTGLVPRRDVLAIVRGAVALAWPSRYEGFGLPVLEAMSVGTPVLSADAAALPEVVGDAGHLLPVDDVEAWVAAMTRMLEDGEERGRLAAAGRERVAGFTWRRTVEATVGAYRDVGAVPPGDTAGPGVAPSVAPDPGAVPDTGADPGAADAGAVPDAGGESVAADPDAVVGPGAEPAASDADAAASHTTDAAPDDGVIP
jgi:glycosyltransferase involved in cell wall biosynthesis